MGADGLAKHGYTVEFGYFQGTCRGSRRPPVQQDRAITDATIVGLGEYAKECDASAERFGSGAALPKRIKTGEKLNRVTYKYEPVYIEFATGTADQQRTAIGLAIAECESDARHARAHARDLKKMADELHGTPLVLIVDEPKVKVAKPVVDVKAGTVTGSFGSKAARKAELDKITRAYEKQIRALQDICLSIPHDQRSEEQSEVYYAPMYPHHWKPKHSALALKVFPQAAGIMVAIEELVAAREVVKNAP
jgi:hypothetical protein